MIDLAGGLLATGLWAGRSAATGRISGLPPMLTHADRRMTHVHSTVEYTEGQKLDIWRPKGRYPSEKFPVFFFIPGGAWVLGKRRPQGYALMAELVNQGWICVAIDYRTAPINRWPAPFYDVASAYQWVRNNIDGVGGDPNFIIMGGASAGGHMASLAGLKFKGAPPQGVVGLYGAYDWESRRSPFHHGFMQFLEKVVVGKSQKRHPQIFRDASPMAQVHKNAPPFLLVHGTKDRLCPVGDARRFLKKLSAVSLSAVEYIEIKGAPHAFDLINPGQTARAVDGIVDFMTRTLRAHRATVAA